MTPEALATAADQLAMVAGDLDAAATRHRGAADGIGTAIGAVPDAWTSPMATQLHTEASGFLRAIAGAPDALASGAGALRSLGSTASALAEELRRHLEAAAAAAAAASAARTQLGAVPADDHETRRLLERRATDQAGAQRAAEVGIQDVQARWDAACLTCAGSLESTMGGLGTALLGPQAAPVAAGASAPGGGVGDELWAFLLGDLAAIWGGNDDVLPLGSGLAGLIRIARLPGWSRRGGVPTAFPTTANGGIGRFLQARVPGFGFLANPVTQRLLTGASVVGGAYTAVTGSIDLWQHGPPLAAFQEHGAGYTADVGRTAFGFGTAGLGALALAGVAAPPVLVIVTVGAGAVWIGSEVVEHWDDITGFVGDRWDDVSGWTADRWDDTTQFAGDLGRGTMEVLGTVGGGTRQLIDGAGDALGSVGEGIGNVAGGVKDLAEDLPLVGGLF